MHSLRAKRFTIHPAQGSLHQISILHDLGRVREALHDQDGNAVDDCHDHRVPIIGSQHVTCVNFAETAKIPNVENDAFQTASKISPGPRLGIWLGWTSSFPTAHCREHGSDFVGPWF